MTLNTRFLGNHGVRASPPYLGFLTKPNYQRAVPFEDPKPRRGE
jgi:hypothetical protein